jgi:hypothetical protein
MSGMRQRSGKTHLELAKLADEGLVGEKLNVLEDVVCLVLIGAFADL